MNTTMPKRALITTISLLLIVAVLAILNLAYGSVSIPIDQVVKVVTGNDADKTTWQYIILESRLPQAVTAMLCGASLATAGLLLQTAFRNPLAGPSILGITHGASLGVGIVMLVTGGVISIAGSVFTGFLAVITGAFIGAMTVIVLLLAFASVVRSNLMLLIVGIMLGYLVSSLVMMLNFFATSDNIHNYVMWGMGSFSDVGMHQLPVFSTGCITGLIMSALLIKPLNALLLGDGYAQNLGVNTHHMRWLLLATTGLLTAVSTAFCGPVAFIGLAVPHITRLLTRTSNHFTLVPANMLTGMAVCLACNLICTLPDKTVIPLNAVTPIFGAPVIIYVMLKRQ